MRAISRIIVLLLLLQAVSIVFLWTIDALNQTSEAVFALFLAVGLVSFAMISYIYRAGKNNENPSRSWLIVGCAMVVLLLLSSLVFV